MNKKTIVPVALGVLLVIFILYVSCGKGKIEINWEPTSSQTTIPDSIILNVYVENSGSMDAYMCDGSNLKDAVYDYVSDLKKNVTQCNLYYINSQIIPRNISLDNYIKNLNPQDFAKAGGNRANTDLRDIFNKVLDNHKANTVSLFISDCILDIPQDATYYFGNCRVSIKNTFNEALSKYSDLGVEIIKLQSKFDGYWFCGKNSEKLSDIKRPYYIWVIGNKHILAMLNQKVPFESILGGIQDYCAYSTSQPIPFDINNKRFAVNHAGKINVDVMVDLRASLQEESLINNVYQYSTSNPLQIKVLDVKPMNVKGTYSHVLSLEMNNPENLKNAEISFSYPQMAEWVKLSNDSTGIYEKSVDKTTGILFLVQGVADAYKDHLRFGSFEFKIKNK